VISLQDYHMLEWKYKKLIEGNANLEATMSIKDKMLKELDDTITQLQQDIEDLQTTIETQDKVFKNLNDYAKQLQQELNKYKLIFKGSYLLNFPEGTFENPEFWEKISEIAKMGEIEVYIKPIDKEGK